MKIIYTEKEEGKWTRHNTDPFKKTEAVPSKENDFQITCLAFLMDGCLRIIFLCVVTFLLMHVDKFLNKNIFTFFSHPFLSHHFNSDPQEVGSQYICVIYLKAISYVFSAQLSQKLK